MGVMTLDVAQPLRDVAKPADGAAWGEVAGERLGGDVNKRNGSQRDTMASPRAGA